MEKDVSKCPPYRLISSAPNGDEKAIQKILDFYDNYISACCMRKLYDEYGNVRMAVDLELKGLVCHAMIQKIKAFEVEIK